MSKPDQSFLVQILVSIIGGIIFYFLIKYFIWWPPNLADLLENIKVELQTSFTYKIIALIIFICIAFLLYKLKKGFVLIFGLLDFKTKSNGSSSTPIRAIAIGSVITANYRVDYPINNYITNGKVNTVLPLSFTKSVEVSVSDLSAGVSAAKQYELLVTVRDGCGVSSTKRLPFSVSVKAAPAIVCVQTLTTSLMKTDDNQAMQRIRAIDFFQDITRDWSAGACSPVVAVGISSYKTILTSHHRILYRSVEDTLFVYAVAGHQQDFQTLLLKRLFKR